MKLRDAIELHTSRLRDALAKKQRSLDRLTAEVAELDRQIGELQTILEYDLKLNHIEKAASEGTAGK